MTTYVEAVKGGFKANRLVYWSVTNILEVVSQRAEQASEGSTEQHRWKDLRIRSRWCTNWLGNTLTGDIESGLASMQAKMVLWASGEVLQEQKTNRILQPVSFSSEPCSMCKALENSFSPNDEIIRNSTSDWLTLYKNVLQALVTNMYLIMADGTYWYNEIGKIRDTLTGNSPAGYPWDTLLNMADTMHNMSRRFMDTGRTCYSQTERITLSKTSNINESQREVVGINLNQKYVSAGADALTADGGLWKVNTELLCQNCKSNVEPDPVEVEL